MKMLVRVYALYKSENYILSDFIWSHANCHEYKEKQLISAICGIHYENAVVVAFYK